MIDTLLNKVALLSSYCLEKILLIDQANIFETDKKKVVDDEEEKCLKIQENTRKFPSRVCRVMSFRYLLQI